jgi:N-acetylneuraminic acid mutarotase
MLRNPRLSAAMMIAALSGVVACSSVQHTSVPAYDGWSLLAALPASNSETGVAAVDGRVFVVGGYPSDRKTVATVQVYDSATDRWQIVAPLPVPLNHVMAAGVNGKLYVIGGQTTESSEPEKAGFVNTTYEYDPATNHWTTRASMPTRRGGGAAAVADGKIYVVGGRPPGGADFVVYDPKADRWTTLPNLPTQRNHLAADSIDGKIYVVGGRFEGGFRSKQSDALEVFDSKTNQWSKRRPMLKPRGGVNGIAANGCFHLFGGEGNAEHPYGIYADHDYYNPVTDTWHRLENMPVAVHGVSGMAFIKGLIHFPGGGTTQGGSTGSVIHQVYKPAMSCK